MIRIIKITTAFLIFCGLILVTLIFNLMVIRQEWLMYAISAIGVIVSIVFIFLLNRLSKEASNE